MSLWDDISKIDVIGDGELPVSHDFAGMLPRDYEKEPFGGFAAPFTGETIPESDWRSIAEKKKRQRTRIIDMIADFNWISGYQSQTNWCWANAVTMSLELCDIIQGKPWERLSAASLAMPIVGGNYGGYIGEALKYSVAHGVATDATWKTNSLSQRKDTAESLASRERNRTINWLDLQSRNVAQLVTSILSDQPKPVPGGFNWMSHAITGIDIDFDASGIMIVTYANSGLYRDKNGYTRLTGSRAIPDSQLAPTWVTGE